MKIDVMQAVRDKLILKRQGDQHDELSKIRTGQRDGVRSIREVREDGFNQKPKMFEVERSRRKIDSIVTVNDQNDTAARLKKRGR